MNELSQLDELIESDVLDALNNDEKEPIKKEVVTDSEDEILITSPITILTIKEGKPNKSIIATVLCDIAIKSILIFYFNRNLYGFIV